MGSWLRSRLTYGNVMASIAVFIALGAGAYAAGLAPNSVKSKHIKDGQVKESDLADGGVTTDKILDGTVSNADLGPREAVQTPTMADCDTATPWSTPVALAITAGFWKDRSGVVHLQGAVGCSGNATEGGAIFTLPSGYRPAGVVRWGALSSNATISQIAVLHSGEVVYDGPDNNSNDNYLSSRRCHLPRRGLSGEFRSSGSGLPAFHTKRICAFRPKRTRVNVLDLPL